MKVLRITMVDGLDVKTVYRGRRKRKKTSRSLKPLEKLIKRLAKASQSTNIVITNSEPKL